jgi:hypothetical protein
MPWAYALLKGQCSPSTWGKIEAEAGFDVIDQNKDAIELKRRIKAVCCGFQSHRQRTYAVAQAIVLLCTTMQENHESIDKYYENFTSRWDMLEQFGGSLGYQTGLVAERAAAIATAAGRADPIDADEEAAEAAIADEMKACLMLCLANKGRYDSLKDHLANQHVLGIDNYPTSCEQLKAVMRNYRAPKSYQPRDRERDRGAKPRDDDGLQFVQADEEDKEKATDEGAIMAQEKQVKFNSKGEKECYSCGADDHWAAECPKKKDGEHRGFLHIQADHGAMILQFRSGAEPDKVKTGGLKKNYLYLDTCTTNDQMVNPAYLSNIHPAEVPLRLHTNAGTSVSRQQGYLGKQKFWLDHMGIANVISLKSLKERYRVTYDSSTDGGAFVVHTDNGDVTFKRCPETSFPFIDLDDVAGGDMGAMLVQTIRKNYEGFTKREVQRARELRELQGRLGHLNESELKQLLKEKDKVSHALLKNCSLTTDDYENANAIFGPSVARLKGTSKRVKPIRAEPNHVRIPRELISMNKYVTLVADVMFVCGLPFLISLSRRVRFVTLEFLPNRTAGELCNGLKNILKFYNHAGFVIQNAIMDNEFEPLKTKLLGQVVLNTTAKNELSVRSSARFNMSRIERVAPKRPFPTRSYRTRSLRPCFTMSFSG